LIGEALKKNITGDKSASGKGSAGAVGLLSKMGQSSKSIGGKSPGIHSAVNSSPNPRSPGAALRGMKSKIGSGSASATG